MQLTEAHFVNKFILLFAAWYEH